MPEPDQTNTPPETPIAPPPAAPAVPAGSVVIDRAEHDNLQARARKAEKDAQKLRDADTAREEQARIDAAKEAGDFDIALRGEREKREKLERDVRKRDVRDAVRDRISQMGFAGSRAAALMRLVDVDSLSDAAEMPGADVIDTEVQATLGSYPDLFAAPAEPDAEEGRRVKRSAGPSNPPEANRGHEDPDYVSPEEYTATAHAIRMTPEFQDRVRKSRPKWPSVVPSSTFAIDG